MGEIKGDATRLSCVSNHSESECESVSLPSTLQVKTSELCIRGVDFNDV